MTAVGAFAAGIAALTAASALLPIAATAPLSALAPGAGAGIDHQGLPYAGATAAHVMCAGKLGRPVPSGTAGHPVAAMCPVAALAADPGPGANSRREGGPIRPGVGVPGSRGAVVAGGSDSTVISEDADMVRFFARSRLKIQSCGAQGEDGIQGGDRPAPKVRVP